jgi:GNAT superfamily N-acetyltransferase
MILLDKEITQYYVRPTVQYIAKHMFEKKIYLTDLYKIGNLTLSRLDKSKNEKIYLLWNKNEKRDVINFEYYGGKNKLRILKIKRHFKELTKKEKQQYDKLKNIEKEKKNILKCPSFIKGYVIIEKKKRKLDIWQVVMSYIHNEYRGKGLGSKLYDAIINHDNLILISDHKQTKDAKNLWTNFIKNKKYNICAIDINNIKKISAVYWNDDTENIESSLPIWHIRMPRNYKKQDIRLIAINKNIDSKNIFTI